MLSINSDSNLSELRKRYNQIHIKFSTAKGKRQIQLNSYKKRRQTEMVATFYRNLTEHVFNTFNRR